MRKTPLRKKGKSKISKLQRELWELCREITRARYGKKCYTCTATGLEGSNRQTGHMWPKASLSAHLKYDLRVLRIQCYRCNINLGGQGAIFHANMLKEIGTKKMAELEKERQILIKADEIWYQSKIAALEQELREI